MITCVDLAFIGGAIFGAINGFLIYLCKARKRVAFAEDESAAALQKFADGRIILSMATLPQAFLLSIPWIYPSPDRIPNELQVPLIFGACVMFVLWIWAAMKLAQSLSGRRRDWFSTAVLLQLLAPILVSSTFVVGLVIGRIR